MSLELLVLTVDDVLFQSADLTLNELLDASKHDAERNTLLWLGEGKMDCETYYGMWKIARSVRGEAARTHFETFLRAYESAFIAVCSRRRAQIHEQASGLMYAAERNGVRLALASVLSSRAVHALMENVGGMEWADRFAVVASADALGPHEGEAELFRLVLRTAEVPAHRSALVTANESSRETALGIGMHAVCVPDGIVGPFSVAVDSDQRANAGGAWPTMSDLEALSDAEDELRKVRDCLAVSRAIG
ncbi:hypothetical protein D8I24_3248 (plasmid) [Cupriavidus necator H850]|uniref:hypothetical protein n=1 Tax=Cupriavidus necator TaxID=106590 RepID=UPI00129DC075|nr:hypothetical protein [Cupriavidus necator]KAI3602697.1 hypothetical protein D8I24_3248 [Cupriavidus necator H850]